MPPGALFVLPEVTTGVVVW